MISEEIFARDGGYEDLKRNNNDDKFFAKLSTQFSLCTYLFNKKPDFWLAKLRFSDILATLPDRFEPQIGNFCSFVPYIWT